MVIAALLAFVVLLAAWILAPNRSKAQPHLLSMHESAVPADARHHLPA